MLKTTQRGMMLKGHLKLEQMWGLAPGFYHLSLETQSLGDLIYSPGVQLTLEVWGVPASYLQSWTFFPVPDWYSQLPPAPLSAEISRCPSRKPVTEQRLYIDPPGVLLLQHSLSWLMAPLCHNSHQVMVVVLVLFLTPSATTEVGRINPMSRRGRLWLRRDADLPVVLPLASSWLLWCSRVSLLSLSTVRKSGVGARLFSLKSHRIDFLLWLSLGTYCLGAVLSPNQHDRTPLGLYFILPTTFLSSSFRTSNRFWKPLYVTQLKAEAAWSRLC